MRNIALIRKSLVLLAALITLSALGGPGTASAVGTTITSTPSGTIFFVRGTWNDSGATLAADVDASPSTTSILISDKNFLPKPGPEGNCATPEDCTIKVDSESMLIEELIDGGYGNPDTMVVQRGMNGTAPGFHPSGRPIKAHTVSVSIYANSVTDSWGLGAFQVYLTLPAGLELVRMTAEPTWLASTGRDPWCDGPFQYGDTWQVSCFTFGNAEDQRYPIGVKGTGLIAKAILLPSQDPGLRAISLAGQLTNTPGTVIPTTSQNFKIKVLECPDANLDGDVDSGDIGQVARNMSDSGVDSGATLVDEVDTSQTIMAISDQSMLLVGDTISVDTEQMTVTALEEGTPDSMTVTRAVNVTRARSHSAGAHIYRATVDGNHDGKKGYTDPRDVNDDDDVDSGDYGLIARTMVSECPAP